MLESLTVGELVVGIIALGGLIGVIKIIVAPIASMVKKVNDHEKRLSNVEDSNTLILGALHALLSNDKAKIDSKKSELESYLYKK